MYFLKKKKTYAGTLQYVADFLQVPQHYHDLKYNTYWR